MEKSDAAFDAFVDDCFIKKDPICDAKANRGKTIASEHLQLKDIQDYWNSDSEVA